MLILHMIVKLGNNSIIVNNVALGGHVEIGDFAIIGGLRAIHQFVKLEIML